MHYCNQLVAKNSDRLYKVLIVEDSEFVNNAVNKTLSSLGYECEQAFDYAVASNKLANGEYDFIILDLNLPDAYGEELVLDVKRLSKAKIIVLTAETDVQSRENLFKIGILDYIVKDKYFSNAIASIHQTIQLIIKNETTTILVVDDSKFIRRHIGLILKVRNYGVIEAENAEEALTVLKSNSANLIILDMELPDKHGLDVMREINAIPELCSLPIICISGNNDPEAVRSSLKLGASDFIKKPFNTEEFVLKVDLAVEINRKDREILCRQQLLNEYKDAVDRSTIVSKTDTHGRITYVNEKFCEISGYTKEELLGKSHNIVRHEDMPSEIFADLWNTLKEKKAWHGMIKNKNKNGEAYFVETVISPIVDFDGKIVEYIGIRTDITELELMKEHLEVELNIADGNLKDMFKRSSEYERAIDASTILSRSTTDGKITYVNQAFCDISGYSKEELIGQTHALIRHPKNSKQLFIEMWETISSGKEWSGQIRHLSKRGEEYYADTTIVPIFDANENIFEHMSISHDVTDTIKLYAEIEDTQREVIHKMGEVGETRSEETGFHVKRVAEYSKLLALLAGLGEKNAALLYSASPMHDIGKVGIPDSILKKPGKLDADEWKIMQTHSELGYNILKDSKRPILKAAAVVAYRHHEKWDGSGYPNGLSGEKIHIFGRITAVADVFDALGSSRCYKKAWELERILELFKEERGKQFDPNLVDLLLNNLDKFLKIRDTFKDI